MSVIVIDPPAALVVSLEEAKAHLRIDFDDEDDYIETLVKVATASIDGPSGWLDQCLISQTLQMSFDDFSGCRSGSGRDWRDCPNYLDLKYPPIIDIVSVKYDDENGVEQTLDPETYRLTGAVRAPRISLVYGKTWPPVRWQSEAVRVQFTSGFGENSEDIPAPIRHAILLTIGHLYENRQSVYVDATRGVAIELPQAVEALLSPFRIFRA